MTFFSIVLVLIATTTLITLPMIAPQGATTVAVFFALWSSSLGEVAARQSIRPTNPLHLVATVRKMLREPRETTHGDTLAHGQRGLLGVRLQ